MKKALKNIRIKNKKKALKNIRIKNIGSVEFVLKW